MNLLGGGAAGVCTPLALARGGIAVVKPVDGQVAHMTDTTRHQSWQSKPPPPPTPDHAGSIPGIKYLMILIYWVVQYAKLAIPSLILSTQ